jgi:preprotein translocase subunit SecG
VPIWLYVPLVVVHVVVAVALILIVLLQAGKGAGIGAAFGGASQTVFGPRGPGNFLSKLTTAAAGLFMITSLVLAIFSAQHLGGSVLLTSPTPKPTASPVAIPSGAEQAVPSTPKAPDGAGTAETPPTQGGGSETTQPEQQNMR